MPESGAAGRAKSSAATDGSARRLANLRLGAALGANASARACRQPGFWGIADASPRRTRPSPLLEHCPRELLSIAAPERHGQARPRREPPGYNPSRGLPFGQAT